MIELSPGSEVLPDDRPSPSRPFILRPVATTLIMLAILLGGLLAYRSLPISALPEVDYPTIQVQTFYPGAGPEVMAATITAPLERQFGEMAGLGRMTSTSSVGGSVITLQFGLSVDLDVAEQEVQAAINAASTLLPDDLPAPPVYAKINPADAPIISLGVTSQTRSLAEVQSLVDQNVANKIAQVPGVGLVSLSGGQRPAVRIEANVPALAARGLSLEQLRSAVSTANVNAPKGTLDGSTRSWLIKANDQLQDPQGYRQMIVAYHDGAPVRLGDVARVSNGSENRRVASWMGNTPAIILDVQRQPGANVIETVDRIKASLPALERALPADVHVRLLSDRTTGIRASIHDVEFELLLAVMLVTLVIFLFLGSARATLVASVSVPLSLIGSFAGMYMFGFSLNNLTLMALTIASGFVVDDAIVVIENIARHLEKGLSPMAAALRGSAEIGFTIVSLTLSLIAVLIPLLFMGDVVGRLFREFAITLAITILISAVVALTLVPMLSARWLKSEGTEKPTRLTALTQNWFGRLSDRYAAALDWVLARQGATLLLFAGTLALTALLFAIIPKGLFPVQDTGQLQVTVRAPQGISFGRMAQIQEQIAAKLLRDPAVESLSSSVGVDGQNPSINMTRMLVNLVGKGDRPAQSIVMARLHHELGSTAGISVFIRPVQDLTIDTESGPTGYRFSLQGSDQEAVDYWAGRLTAALQQSPKLSHIVSNVLDEGKSVTVSVNRDTAARLGITAEAVDNALYDAFGQRIVSTIFTQAAQHRVILEGQKESLNSPEALGRVYVSTAAGELVPLSAIASFETGPTSLLVNRVAQFPAATIGFDLAPDVSLEAGVKAIGRIEQQIGMPETIQTQFTGAANAFRSSLSNELLLVIAAVLVVYIVLGVLYESFVHPVTILSTLPSAAIGALLALMLTGNDLGVIGIIAIVLLIGIVKKNAIMMIDFALEAKRDEGRSPHDAIRQAALLRFRPIMMTTFAALFSALPLIFGGGMGSELRQPLGIAIAGGLIVSQALTLFTTPVIFLGFERIAARFSDGGSGEREPELPMAQA